MSTGEVQDDARKEWQDTESSVFVGMDSVFVEEQVNIVMYTVGSSLRHYWIVLYWTRHIDYARHKEWYVDCEIKRPNPTEHLWHQLKRSLTHQSDNHFWTHEWPQRNTNKNIHNTFHFSWTSHYYKYNHAARREGNSLCCIC